MASAPDPIVVSGERSVHDALTNAFQLIADEYGLRVMDVSVNWTDASSPITKKYIVTGLNVSTRS